MGPSAEPLHVLRAAFPRDEAARCLVLLDQMVKAALGPDDPATLALLKEYAWPGNVRELHNVIERTAALADGPIICVEHLPERIMAARPDGAPLQEAASYKQAKQEVVRSFERNFLLDLLKRHDWHMSNAAQEAGVDRKTVERMVKRHGLREPRKQDV